MTDIITREQVETLQKSNRPEDIEEAISVFAAQQDVKPSSRSLYISIMRGFFRWVLNTGRIVSELTSADIIAYKEAELSQGISSLTVASHVNGVRRFYEWAEASKYYPNIAKSVHAPKRRNDEFRHKPLSVAKVGELLRYVKENKTARDYAIISLMLYTGLRCVEVSRADIGDITYIGENNTRVLMVQGKGHDEKDDFVQLVDAPYKAIRNYLAERPNADAKQPLFTSESNNNEGGRMTTRAISALVKECLKAIGLDSHLFTAHSLRHTAGTSVLRAGGSLEEAQMLLRHTNPATTEIYVKMALKERRLTEGGEARLADYYNTAM